MIRTHGVRAHAAPSQFNRQHVNTRRIAIQRIADPKWNSPVRDYEQNATAKLCLHFTANQGDQPPLGKGAAGLGFA